MVLGRNDFLMISGWVTYCVWAVFGLEFESVVEQETLWLRAGNKQCVITAEHQNVFSQKYLEET